MAEKNSKLGVLSLAELLEMTGLPPRFQLIKEGLDVSIDSYRKVVLRVARSYLGALGLDLREIGPEEYELVTLAGAEWRDVAYELGHWANIKVGQVVVADPEDLLRHEPLSRDERHYADYREAVLGNLGLIKAEPASEEENLPARSLRAALEAVREVEKVRHAA